MVNQKEDAKSVARDSWHRFSAKKKSHGWCDFSPCVTVLDPRAGFLSNDTLVVAAEILILSETMQVRLVVIPDIDQEIHAADTQATRMCRADGIGHSDE